MIPIIIIVAFIVLLLIYFVMTYNTLIQLRNKVKNQWSQIDVVLKRRFDLIPNLVETVKGYASHEKETLEGIIEARNKFANASTQEEEIDANNQITGALNKLFALSEAYPDLKANENFINLQNELKETEDKITYSRQFYNDSVLKYNNKLQMFPSNIVGSIGGFKAEKFFEANGSERENVKVEF